VKKENKVKGLGENGGNLHQKSSQFAGEWLVTNSIYRSEKDSSRT